MATTTPNYGWAVPTSTDLVKDGATAIETLGDAIDASMNTALGTKKAGMVLLNTTSFSGVSGISLPASTFTSTYRNYKFLIEVSGASASGIYNMRLRASGSDNTTANYQQQSFYSSGATVASSRTTNQTSYSMNSINTNRNFYDFTIYAPQIATETLWQINGGFNPATTSLESNGWIGGFSATTQFDSLSFYSTGANISGIYRVYGYND